MYDLKIKQMECFMEVATSLNLTTSAKKLFISQPSASKWIQSLEEELDVKLFVRGKTGLELTEEGEYLRDQWAPLLKGIRDSVVNCHLLNNQTERVLRIGCLDMCQYGEYFQRLLQRYRELNPMTTIDVSFYKSKELVDKLMERSLDVIFHPVIDLKDNSDFTCYPVKRMDFCVAMAKDHPLAGQENISIKDIEGQLCYVLNFIESPMVLKRIQNRSKTYGMDIQRISEAANFSSIVMKLLSNMNAIALVPEDSILGYSDQLKVFNPEEFAGDEFMALVVRADLPGEPAKRFAEYVSNYVREFQLL